MPGQLKILPNDLLKTIASYLPHKDVINLARTSKAGYSIFQPIANELKALLAVAHGAQASLVNLIQRTREKHPELLEKQLEFLFKKGPIVDPRGRFIPSISPYQLIIFLCDEVMKNAIIPLIPKEMESIRQRQYKELGSGGADLIKLNKNPKLIEDIQELRKFNTTYPIDGNQVPFTFSLLENPDGIIFYQDEQDKVHFYYVNQNTKALICLEPKADTPEVQLAWDTFIASFMTMEQNSARRSSDAEYQLMQQTLQITVHREGIRYQQEGEWFQDSRTKFNLINQYRKCIRLYYEAEYHGGEWDVAHKFWREEVGKAQGEEMWVLQRICEKGRPFYPLPKNFNGFNRGFAYDNGITKKNDVLVFSKGKLDSGLGKDFCLYKAGVGWRGMGGRSRWRAAETAVDLVAVCRLVESAKANVVEEFKLNQDLASLGAHPKY